MGALFQSQSQTPEKLEEQRAEGQLVESETAMILG